MVFCWRISRESPISSPCIESMSEDCANNINAETFRKNIQSYELFD